MSPQHQKLLIFLIATAFSITGFCISVLYYQSVYALNQKIVMDLQQTITSHAFKVFMNIISNIFNPTVCAGYILILYVLTARKLEVIAFLLWFLFLSWILSILKQIFQQPRPFWVNPNVQMLEWTCYTQYGNPSGHSALVIVLLDFFVRFGCRWKESFNRLQVLWYTLVLFTQITVMFSRMYLGMHSLNQVLFGFMLGAYSLLPYYLYVEKVLFTFCIKYLQEGKKAINVVFMVILLLFMALQQLLLTYLPTYHPPDEAENGWIATIVSHPACSKSYRYATSFYLRCFQDSTIAFGIPAMMISLSATHNGYSLLKKLKYPKLSWKFFAYLMTTLIIAMIPVAVFLNPEWKKMNIKQLALFLWFFNGLGFICGIISLVGVSSYFLKLFKLDDYDFQSYYNEYRIVTEGADGKKEIEMVNVEVPTVTENDFKNV